MCSSLLASVEVIEFHATEYNNNNNNNNNSLILETATFWRGQTYWEKFTLGFTLGTDEVCCTET
jgi:hypothetical protein